MKKIINIEGRDIAFASNGATLLLYKKEFKKDFLKEIISMSKTNLKKQKVNANDVDLGIVDTVNEFAYICAKTADKNIGGHEDWLASFDSPTVLFEHMEAIMSLIGNGMETSVEPKDKKK